jgi:hypothetical protein
MTLKSTVRRAVRVAFDEAVAQKMAMDGAIAAVTKACGSAPPDGLKLPAAVYRHGLVQLGVDIPRDLAPAGFQALFEQHAANARAGRLPRTIAADAKQRASLTARFGANVSRLKSGAI